MNNPLMQYLESGADRTTNTSDLPPLDLATVSQQYFGKKAWDYELVEGDEHKKRKWDAEYTGISEGLKGCSGTLIDIACGTGRFFPIYKEYGLDFIGFDVSADMLHQAKTKYPWAKVEEADIRAVKLPEKGFDYAVCAQFLKFLPENELAQVIQLIGRVTKKRILCSIHTGERTERRNRAWIHTVPAFQKAMEDAGFEIRARGDIDPPHHHLWLCEAM